jgi:hypothetical protein
MSLLRKNQEIWLFFGADTDKGEKDAMMQHFFYFKRTSKD